MGQLFKPAPFEPVTKKCRLNLGFNVQTAFLFGFT